MNFNYWHEEAVEVIKDCYTCKFEKQLKLTDKNNYICNVVPNRPIEFRISGKNDICEFWKPKEEETVSKPPLGVMPEKIWKLHRCQNLARAIQEYLHCDEIKTELIYEWVDELHELIEDME